MIARAVSITAFVTLAATVTSLADQGASPPAARVLTVEEYANAMRELHALDTKLRNNIEEVARADLERMLLFEATMNARNEAARIEEVLGDVSLFWEARKQKDAIRLSRDALTEAANISKALAVIDLHSPSAATLAQERLGKICSSCHAAYREKLPDGTFRIK
jgi:hypothetical protein